MHARLQPWPLAIKSVGRCCDLLNDTNGLVGCVNASAALSASSRGGVSLCTLVAAEGVGQFAVNDIWSFAAYQIALVGAYAEHNEYAFRVFTDEDIAVIPRELDPRWYKIRLLRAALEPMTGWAKDSEFLVWVDADAIVLDLGMRIEVIAAQYPLSQLIASADVRQGLINSGFLILRNSAWTRNFLDRWWNTVDRTLLCDQDAFEALYRQIISEERRATEALEFEGATIERLVTILPRDALNSDPPAAIHQKTHNQVLHLMGESSALRSVVFREAMVNMCSARSGGVVPAQLGLTRRILTTLAVNVYRVTVDSLLSRLAKVTEIEEWGGTRRTSQLLESESGGKLSTQILSVFDMLAKSTHRLCELLVGDARSGAPAQMEYSKSLELFETLSMRREVFLLSRQWADAVRTELIQTKSSWTGSIDEPKKRSQSLSHILVSLLKRTAESGNDLFGSSLSHVERRSTADAVFTILEELSARLIPESRSAATHMAALMHQNLGVLDLELYQGQNNIRMDTVKFTERFLNSSRGHFEQSTLLFATAFPPTHPPDRSALIEKLHSMQLLATVFCSQREFDAGISQWTETLNQAQRLMDGVLLGQPLKLTAEISFNAAQCNEQAGYRAHALKLAQEAAVLAAADINDESRELLRAIRAFIHNSLESSVSDNTFLDDEWEEFTEDGSEIQSNHRWETTPAQSNSDPTATLLMNELDTDLQSVRFMYERQAVRYTVGIRKLIPSKAYDPGADFSEGPDKDVEIVQAGTSQYINTNIA